MHGETMKNRSNW